MRRRAGQGAGRAGLGGSDRERPQCAQGVQSEHGAVCTTSAGDTVRHVWPSTAGCPKAEVA
eukprot:2311107-Lingulodinium_polyedra.AAC.1